MTIAQTCGKPGTAIAWTWRRPGLRWIRGPGGSTSASRETTEEYDDRVENVPPRAEVTVGLCESAKGDELQDHLDAEDGCEQIV